MTSPRELEEKVGKRTPRKPSSLVALMMVFLLTGIGMIITGYELNNNQNKLATADVPVPGVPPDPERPTSDEPIPAEGKTTVPPTPSDSPSVSSIVPLNPVSPSAPTEPANISFPAGWSMISGQALQGYDLSPFSSKSVVLYSYNDPAYPNREWSTYPAAGNSAIQAVAPLGYYVYSSSAQSLTLNPSGSVPTGLIFARGWHLLYWPGQIADKDGLLSAIKLTYSDGKTMTAAEAAKSQNHRISAEIYVVVDQNVVSEGAGVIKKLSDSDSGVLISKIPKDSYFWLYLRRTQNRVTNIGI